MGERVMKRVCKGLAPKELQDYMLANPDATWEQMSSDNTQDGSKAAHKCRDQAIDDQNGLCAYCEQEISSEEPLHRRIEHFHPKSDKTGNHKWSLDWDNMLAVCDGGSSSPAEDKKHFPLPENLSCDAHKDRMIQIGKFPTACEGYILNPLAVPAFPNLFALEKDTGYFKPNEASCAVVEISGNAYETTAALVEQTILALNLNCARLAKKRKLLVYDIEHNKKNLRKRNIPPSKAPEKLINRYFSIEWPEFFTTLRCCLGQAAEDYLHSVNYQG